MVNVSSGVSLCLIVAVVFGALPATARSDGSALNFVMLGDELEAIRAKRLAELQAQYGGNVSIIVITIN